MSETWWRKKRRDLRGDIESTSTVIWMQEWWNERYKTAIISSRRLPLKIDRNVVPCVISRSLCSAQHQWCLLKVDKGRNRGGVEWCQRCQRCQRCPRSQRYETVFALDLPFTTLWRISFLLSNTIRVAEIHSVPCGTWVIVARLCCVQRTYASRSPFSESKGGAWEDWCHQDTRRKAGEIFE